MLLEERGKTHGSFTNNANVSQDIKLVLKHSKNWAALSNVQKESLEMIGHKIARILSGDPNLLDHWQDIVGYAQLVVNYLEEKKC